MGVPKRNRKLSGQIERRARAAAELAGLEWKELAEALGPATDTLDRRLRNIDRGLPLPSFETPESVTRQVADACGLPYEFFTVDFRRLPELADRRSGRVREMAVDGNGGTA